MTEKRLDPRVVRTRTLLLEALIDMIQHRRWEKIRVQDLLEKTGVSRSAFYAHFDNKYDLLTSEIPELMIEVDDDGRPDLLPLFAHVNEMAPILRPLLSQPVLSEIADTFHHNLARSWTDYLTTTPHAGDEVLTEILAGSVGSLVRAYADQDTRQDPITYTARVSTHLARLLGEQDSTWAKPASG